MTPMPDRYRELIEPLISAARNRLERGEALAPVAFVGSFTTNDFQPVLIRSSSEDAKDQSALAIKAAAHALDADYVFVIMEAWSLRKDKLAQRDRILEKYGSIGASPYAVDILSLALETWHGIWVAEAHIKPKGVSKKKRTIGVPEFRHYTEFAGRFVDLLPVKAAAGTLH